MLDPEILDYLDQLQENKPFNGEVWRVTWKGRDPLVGSASGGRWSPQNDFEALYASLEKDGALAEIYHHLSQAPVFSSAEMCISKLFVKLGNVLKLDIQTLNEMGVKDPLATRIDYGITQQISAAAHLFDYEGLIVPSARYDCLNLVLFMDRISLDAQLDFVPPPDDINWPAWREKHKNNSKIRLNF